jgi:acetylornithine/succinyldiaminopimelate/putrescine aminotransferase
MVCPALLAMATAHRTTAGPAPPALAPAAAAAELIRAQDNAARAQQETERARAALAAAAQYAHSLHAPSGTGQRG